MALGRKPSGKYPKRNSRNLTPEERAEAFAKNRRPIQKKVLEALCKTLLIRPALRKCKVPNNVFHRWMRTDAWFKRQYERFLEEAVLSVETKGIQVASRGVRKRSYAKDVGFYFNREYSPDLIKFFLRTRKSKVYGNKLGITVDLNQAVQIVIPHNGRDVKNTVMEREPCGAKPAKIEKAESK